MKRHEKHSGVKLRLRWIFIIGFLSLLSIFFFWWSSRNAAENLAKQRADRRRPDLATLLRRADAASGAGDRERAKSLFRQVLAMDEANPTALLNLAVYVQGDGDLDGATELLKRIPRAEPSIAAKAYYLEASIALEKHRAREAERLLKLSFQATPAFLPPQSEYLRLLSLQLRKDDLISFLNNVSLSRSLTAEEATFRLLAGRPTMESSVAIRTLGEFLKADPEDIDSLAALVRYHLIDGNTADVAALIQKHQLLQKRLKSLSVLDYVLFDATVGEVNRPSVLQLNANELSSIQGDEVWEYLWPLIVEASNPEVSLSIAQKRRRTDPFSIAASHALAGAFERCDRQDEAKQEREMTIHLDQIELLAYRMMRPQSSHPEFAKQVAIELVQHLQAIGQLAAAREWIVLAGEFTRAAGQSDVSLDQMLKETSSVPNYEPTTAVDVPHIPDLSLRRPDTKVVDPGGSEWKFVDCADEYQVDFQYHNGRTAYKRILETVGGGVAVLDFDHDLWPDLYFPQGQVAAEPPEGLPAKDEVRGQELLNDQVYRNIRGETLNECSNLAGIRELSHSLAASSGDIDNDGFPEVLVTNVGSCSLYENLGDGTFEEMTPPALAAEIGCWSGACLADFDGDGALDLCVLNYVGDWDKRCINSEGQFATCDPRELRSVENRIYRNNGDSTFENVTATSGLGNLTGRALGVVASNFVGDLKVDVFIANDGLPNMLLRNDSRPGSIQFQNVATSSGVAVPESGRSHAGMGVAVDDFDQNGFSDIFVTNFYREQNTLYSAVAPEVFVDESRFSGLGPVSLSYLGFGVQPIDVESDGRTDLVIMNGDIDDYSASGRPWKMPMTAFRNQGNRTFEDMSLRCGDAFRTPQLGRGLSRVDLNGDGRDDLVGIRHDGAARILINQTSATSPAVKIQVIGRTSNRDAIGAVVHIADDDSRSLILQAGDGFAAKNETVLHLIQTLAHSPLKISWGNETIADVVDLGSESASNFAIRQEGTTNSRAWVISK